MIADHLSQRGFEVILIQDDYYNPSQDFDLRLSIIRGLSRSAYVLYSSFLYSAPLVLNKEVQKQYLKIMNELESGSENLDQTLLKMQQHLEQEAAIIPLFCIPSMYYSRLNTSYNPLTETFHIGK